MWDEPSDSRSDIFNWDEPSRSGVLGYATGESDDSSFANYEIREPMRGGRRGYYRARSGKTGEVALLRAPLSFSRQPWQVEEFLDRARASAILDHPSVARLKDFGEANGRCFVALEYINGKDLDQVRRRLREIRRRMPLGLALHTVIGICDGLIYAQSAKDADGRPLARAFRVISPRDVMVSRGGDVKLLSLGVGATGFATDIRSTAYMAPELAAGRVVDQRAALFSVGVILYEMVTGQRLFGGRSEDEVRANVCSAEIRRPSTVNRVVPKPLDEIIMRALARDPSDRYFYAVELRAELDSFAHVSGLQYSHEQVARWMKTTFAADDGERAEQVVNKLRGTSLPAPTHEPRSPVVRPKPVQQAAARARQVLRARRATGTSQMVASFADPDHAGVSRLDAAMKARRAIERRYQQTVGAMPGSGESPESSMERLRRVVRPQEPPPLEQQTPSPWVRLAVITLALVTIAVALLCGIWLLTSSPEPRALDLDTPLELEPASTLPAPEAPEQTPGPSY